MAGVCPSPAKIFMVRKMKAFKNLTKSECEYYIENCRFLVSNGELEVFRLLCDGKTIVSISLVTHLSTATVSRRISSIKQKIKDVAHHDRYLMQNRTLKRVNSK